MLALSDVTDCFSARLPIVVASPSDALVAMASWRMSPINYVNDGMGDIP
jgi:hypothetical protein